MPKANPRPWWARAGLAYARQHLCIAGHSVADLAAQHSSPLYLYDETRVHENLGRLHAAFDQAALPHRIFYAMKSNRHPELLEGLRRLGRCGVDTCSPAEVAAARAAGFAAKDISFTGTSLSDRDLAALLEHPGLILNLDSLHDIKRVAQLAPGRSVGLRINPGLGTGYRSHQRLRYAGAQDTKFGLHREQFPAALRAIRQGGLIIDGLHFHTGCGFLSPQLKGLKGIFRACTGFIEKLPRLRYLNVGGGLGIPLDATDEPLDVVAWTQLLKTHFGDWADEIWCEPGDYLVKDAGLLVLEVNTVETKGRTLFAGVNGGFSLHPEPAFYQLPIHPVPTRQPGARARLQPTTIAGNINEAHDLLHQDAMLPKLRNGDLLAFLNAGGYGAAMASRHCLRGEFQEVVLPAVPPPPRK